ncbi:hypothetical protein C0Q70_20137 [Pomacea canaliculata]|uniref:Major facilitator superfamily (MFS) profile domain-containing protein n=1 Tax=Pomacea canaliculata TaxID=400727 RepID=A0A2T7NEP1_POMCA|nr:hypothetical protein C0Q70_20137 [Pomacea canaliculata]
MEEETASQAMDAVFMELGWCGKYQLLQLFQILLCIFPLAFNVLSVVFLSKANNHWCREIDNVTGGVVWDHVTNITYGECTVTFTNSSITSEAMPCPDGLVYAEPADHSMVSQWGLVCENEALADVSQTLLMIGMCVGAFSFTTLADKYGRKLFHVGCHLGLLAVGVAQAFVPTFVAYLPLRFFSGRFSAGSP